MILELSSSLSILFCVLFPKSLVLSSWFVLLRSLHLLRFLFGFKVLIWIPVIPVRSSLLSSHAHKLRSNPASIKSAASTIASGVLSFYNGNTTGQVPGLLPDPYYWWEGGAMFDTLIQYWRLTGDSQYNSLTAQALLFQQGDLSNFMPLNQTKTLGNDDQTMWALAAMSAAETSFPETEGQTKWLALAVNVFNDLVERWDEETCGGGLRWQIFSFNRGYEYKDGISTGMFFQLSARLARFTGNATYADWAEKSFTWAATSGFIDEKFNVWDGASANGNCSTINKLQKSYAAGNFIVGAAYMYNLTSSSSKWKIPLDGLLSSTLTTFFSAGIATEVICESLKTCNIDQRVFKALLANWLVDTILIAPYTSDSILPKITSSAEAAAKGCEGGHCALIWGANGGPDGISRNLGNDLSSLGFVQGLLVRDVKGPAAGGNVTGATGGGSGTGVSTSAIPSGTNSGTPSATSTGNAASGRFQNLGMGSAVVLLGAVKWIVL
jgi:mannan endo-1,6-alpha-mannosidase